ncbi:MAG: S4 domain-containing protein YaaA [Proteocatella sp.]|nr:S4 domain-containing protein YaaA [Proteocatella sp.]MBP8654233.1 S4 domain-containing protein YaaA [Proteocatella sp.]MBP9658638.1 S4 domain-containing protein YaaA [Proteocatella sp.]MBP9966404.1 S4 domain-containing protein YaaA [Proteocatella sp.]
MEKIKIDTEFIKLDQFLKMVNIAGSGGQAKIMIISEDVKVNGTIETQRGKKLRSGDVIEAEGRKFQIL